MGESDPARQARPRGAVGGGSCGLRRLESAFEARDLVAQEQATLLHAAQSQVVSDAFERRAVDQAVEVGVLDAQFDQAALRRMQVLIHRCAVTFHPNSVAGR
jgi:hypothetical protein